MIESIEVLTQMIVLYTNQLEELDRQSGSIAMTAVTICGVFLGIIFTLYPLIKKRNDQINDDNKNIRRALLIVLLCIPAVIGLFMYIFSMSCRKVAIYRGYLHYLEETLNSILVKKLAEDSITASSDILLFDNHLVNAYIAGNHRHFFTNQLGPFFMAAFLIIIFFIIIWITRKFLKYEDKSNKGFFKFYINVFRIVFAFSVVLCLLCTVDFVYNGKVVHDLNIEYFINEK